MEVNLVEEGVKFMALGMGTVFMFLVLMIGVLNLQAYIIQRFFPEKQEQPKPKTVNSVKDNKKVVAAIVGAISAYKK
jgi:oxaloacetate decarboxylase gamma subunit